MASLKNFLKFLLYEFLRVPAFMAFVVLFRFRIFGARHIPRGGPVIISSNHQSFFDPLIVGLGVARHLHFMTRRSLFRFAPFRWLILGLNAYPVEREGADIRGMRETIRRIDEGNAVVVFPEGTRTCDGRVNPFRRGISIIARESGAPIVPAGISGAYRAWPRKSPLFRFFVPVTVRYGPCVRARDKTECRKLPEELHRMVVSLSGSR